MTENECLDRMIAPGTRRPGKYREGVIQIHVTRACNLACYSCTQGSNLGGRTSFMSPEHFELALQSIEGYFGVVGVFGGNPALSPHFGAYCLLLQKYFPKEQRGLWCNHPKGWGNAMRETFDPRVSNLNVHMDQAAHDEFRRDWPESMPFGLDRDSRHSPPFVAMKDLGIPEGDRWELISKCDVNQQWSALLGVFRGQLRAWFCEIAGAQSMLYQDEPGYPDTGLDLSHPNWALPGVKRWWELGMESFAHQVRKHCHECGIPLRGRGSLAVTEPGVEQVSTTHLNVYKLKRKDRPLETVNRLEQLHTDDHTVTKYLQR